MYDEISELYHLIYEDWEASIAHQAAGIDRLITESLGEGPVKLLDISCGIGTQALGLAALGHDVTASDLSTSSVRRAEREVQDRGLNIHLSVADMQDCFSNHGGGFDVVLTCDNSLPHLENKEQIAKTFRGMLQCLRPGGLALVGMRDYGKETSRGRDQLLTYGIRQFGDKRYIVYQTRDWTDDHYDVGMYFVQDATPGEPARVVSGHSRYYAIELDEVGELLGQSGFENIVRRDDAIYQPVITAVRPGEPPAS